MLMLSLALATVRKFMVTELQWLTLLPELVTLHLAILYLKTDCIRRNRVSSAVSVLKGVPIITLGSLISLKNGNPGMPIFTGCVYFHNTGSPGMQLIDGHGRWSVVARLVGSQQQLHASWREELLPHR